jgi:3-methyladenine DNA glycosylase AlkD
MTLEDAMLALIDGATTAIRDIEARKGAGKDQFGVRLGDIRAIARRSGTDHQLALQLWATGNLDARLLATLVVTPARLDPETLDAMVREASVVQLADWLYAHVVQAHPDKEVLRQRWLADADPMTQRAAWALTADRIARAREGLDITALLERLAAEMPDADPAAQWSMNAALVQIGIACPDRRKRAVEIAEAHGIYRDVAVPKGCTPPYAPLWIGEMVRRQG